MSVFFTSDLHFGHANAIRFDNRGFKDIEEMERELIARWNKKVSQNDTVYILGDMFWRLQTHQMIHIMNSLNGKKILIKGNHDGFANQSAIDGRMKNASICKLFTDIKDYDDICVTLKDGTKKRCILCHYYMPTYNGARYGSIMLHGHSHSSIDHIEEMRFAEELKEKGVPNIIVNVGCMHWNYEPVTLDEILDKIL